jgi:hypothetical protein
VFRLTPPPSLEGLGSRGFGQFEEILAALPEIAQAAAAGQSLSNTAKSGGYTGPNAQQIAQQIAAQQAQQKSGLSALMTPAAIAGIAAVGVALIVARR